jgi:hypothetical protein
MFGIPENYRTESVVFDIAEANLPFSTILGRSVLYRFMSIAHYGYLVLKMSSPNNFIKIHVDRSTDAFAQVKLQKPVAMQEVVAGYGEQD